MKNNQTHEHDWITKNTGFGFAKRICMDCGKKEIRYKDLSKDGEWFNWQDDGYQIEEDEE